VQKEEIIVNYLEKKKIEIINNCKICEGKNTSCSCHELFAFEAKKFYSGIPPLLNQPTVDLKELKEKNVQDFLEGKVLGLFIEGGTRLKKALILTKVLEKCLKKEENVYFINFSDWIQLVTDTWWGKNWDKYEEICRKDVLGFNDVGDERRNESNIVENILYNILRDRLYCMKRVVIASSLNIETFVNIYVRELADLLANNFKVLSLPQIKLENIFKEIRK